MRRATYLFMILMVVAFAGCSNGGDNASQEVAKQPQPVASTEKGQPAIPEPEMPAEATVGAFILPSFSEDGTVKTRSVAPGEVFDLFIIAEHAEPLSVAAAAFRLALPTGVKISGEHKFHPNALAVGEAATNMQMAFECHAPGKYFLIRFVCQVEDGFTGGEITVSEGVNPAGVGFLGFASCNVQPPEKVPATGGSVTLSLKS